jgi:hypothetical protein
MFFVPCPMKTRPFALSWTAPSERGAMRILSGSPELGLPTLHPLALILAAVAPAV